MMKTNVYFVSAIFDALSEIKNDKFSNSVRLSETLDARIFKLHQNDVNYEQAEGINSACS